MKRASWLALAFVLLLSGGSFYWWAKNRPSFLLYQAHRHLGKSEQSAVVSKYRQLLEKKNLPLDQELQLRKSLGEFYLHVLQENAEFSIYMRDDYEVGRAFLDSAKKEFQIILSKDPADAFSRFALGQIFLWEKLESFGLAELQECIKGMPHNPEPLRILSLVHQERGEASLGLEYALKAVAVNPADAPSRRALISAYVLLGQREKALSEYEQLSSSDRSYPEVQAGYAMLLSDMNYWARAENEILSVIKKHPQNGTVRLIYGQMLLAQNRPEEASGQLLQAADYLPRHLWPLVWQADAFFEMGRCEEISRVGQLLIDSFPRWAWAHLVNAKALLCRNSMSAAMTSLDEALRLSPDFPEARKTKALWLLEQQRFSELGSFLRPWLDERANEAEAYVFLAESFFQQGKMELCVEMSESAIRLDSRDWRPFYWLGAARLKKEDLKGSERAFSNAMGVNSENAHLRGGIAYARGNIDELQNLLRTQGRNYVLWTYLGQLLYDKKEFSDALSAFQRATSVRPEYLASQLGLIKTHWALNDMISSGAALTKALEINSAHKEVLFWRSKIRRH